VAVPWAGSWDCLLPYLDNAGGLVWQPGYPLAMLQLESLGTKRGLRCLASQQKTDNKDPVFCASYNLPGYAKTNKAWFKSKLSIPDHVYRPLTHRRNQGFRSTR
jgi:hypothetical protein